MLKGVGNKGKSLKKKSKTMESGKKMTTTSKKIVMFLEPKTKTTRHIWKTNLETEEQKMQRCHLKKAGLIPKDPTKTHNSHFV